MRTIASGPITLWQIDREKVEMMTDFIFLGSKITADGDCSHKIKRLLLLRRKAITNLDSILKSRDITLLTKVHIIKAIVFPIVMYGCESWTIMKAEHRKLRLLSCDAGENPWESLGQQKDQSSQSQRKSTLNIHWKDWCWDWNSSALATWYKELNHWKRPDARQNWGQEEKGAVKDKMVVWHHWLNGHEFKQTLGDNEG